jgi:hypothetical protein
MPKIDDSHIQEWFYEEDEQSQGPISRAEMVNLIKAKKISYGSLVWKKGFPDWAKAENTEWVSFLQNEAPPPISGEHVKNQYVWNAVFMPWGVDRVLLWLKFGWFLKNANRRSFVMMGVSIFFCWLDARYLKSIGHDTDKFDDWDWLPPVYMYSRAKNLRQKQVCSVVWLIFFALWLIVRL